MDLVSLNIQRGRDHGMLFLYSEIKLFSFIPFNDYRFTWLQLLPRTLWSTSRQRFPRSSRCDSSQGIVLTAIKALSQSETTLFKLFFVRSQIVEKFESMYAVVDDIDLFIAGVSERPAKGAMVGPTFQCIIADQFLRLKRGDRYFYDLGGQAGSFTEGKIKL